MNIYYHFTVTENITPEQLHQKKLFNIVFINDQDGRDWYSIADSWMFDDDYTFIVFDSEGVVRSFDKDPTKLFPVGNSVVRIASSNLPNEISIEGKWIFDGEIITLNRSFIKKQNENIKNNLKSIADSEIEWRKDSVEMKIASDMDKNDLNNWIVYRIRLMKTVVTDSKDMKFPNQPEIYT